MAAQALEGFERSAFDALGVTRDVWRIGTGPAVIVLSEIPGITPAVASFARAVADRGMSVAMPHLFGDDGREPSSAYLMRSMLHGCVSREFTVFALGKSSPIVNWIRVLARAEHGRWGGPGVGVVGMCFTGGFALGVMADAPVVAPVLSQPGLPAPIGTRRKAAIDCTDAEFAAVKRKVAAGAHVLGLRFTCDTMVPAQRFATLRRELGDGFIGVEIDSSPGNPYGNRKGAHSVLTEDLIDREGSPTLAALHQVLDFLAARLEVTSGGG